MKKRVWSLLLAAMITGTSSVNLLASEQAAVVTVSTETAAEVQTEAVGEENLDQLPSNQTEAATEEAADTVTSEQPEETEGETEAFTETETTTEKETEQVEEENTEVVIKETDKPYLALGADLTAEQLNKVLQAMGIDAANLTDYDVSYITNEEEHKYLGSYMDASKIGTRSLSSVVIVEREKGSGLNISISNINYCTVGMYKNALTTAGITDADIIVAGPSPISGTAALVGIFKSYQNMTGETIEENVIDAALNELIVTGELSSVLDQFSNEEIEEFIAYIKAVVAERELKDADSINQVIDEACEKYGVTLSDEYRQQIVDLLLKITSLGIDLSGLVSYAENLYHNFKNGGSSNTGVIATVVTAIANVFSSIADFFKGLFGMK